MKKLKIVVNLMILVLAATSCKKQLDIVPTGTINETNAFQTVADLEQGLLGVYSAWDGNNTMYINALLSDEVKISMKIWDLGSLNSSTSLQAEVVHSRRRIKLFIK